jgi:DNA-binding transcriptional MerR regulator
MGFVARPVLLRTGAFARAPTLSLKALRVYHEMGLLVPSVMDPETGYRAYSPAQLTDTAIIRLLREVGVSLQDITTVLDARDLGFVRKVLPSRPSGSRRVWMRLAASWMTLKEEADLGGCGRPPGAGAPRARGRGQPADGGSRGVRAQEPGSVVGGSVGERRGGRGSLPLRHDRPCRF